MSNLNVARSLKRQIQEREVSITFQIECKFPPFPFFCTTCFDLTDPPFQPTTSIFDCIFCTCSLTFIPINYLGLHKIEKIWGPTEVPSSWIPTGAEYEIK